MNFDTVEVSQSVIDLGRNQSQHLRSVIPLIGIAGSRGKTTIACMLDRMVRAAGFSSARWISSGVFVNDDLLEGELGPWQRVLLAARHAEVDVALQELNAPTVVAVGLPTEAYPIVIISTICGNNEACLLSNESRLEHQSLEIVVNSLRADGLIIACADDFDVTEAVERSNNSRLHYAMRRENPALTRHLDAGGAGAWIQDRQLTIGTATSHMSVIPISEIPSTLDGSLIFQIQNALGACLAAHSIGVPVAAIASALREFLPDPDVQPAACNVFDYNGATVVVDMPHQIWSMKLLLRGIRGLPRRRTMVVTGAFPHLSLEDVAEAGRLLGTLGAIVMLHEDGADDVRLNALRHGISAAPVPPLVVQVNDEIGAIDQMLNKVGEDDLALVLASDPAQALTHLWPAPVIRLVVEGAR